jgi:hypothetical protein
MLWNTQTLDPDVMQLLGDNEEVLGVVRYQGNGRYMASTQKLYLGVYPTLKFAQKAVEVGCKVIALGDANEL